MTDQSPADDGKVVPGLLIAETIPPAAREAMRWNASDGVPGVRVPPGAG